MKRHLIKSCCSGKGYILELDKPLSKSNLSFFKKAGYTISNMYTNVGVFFVEKGGMTASSPFGSMKLNIRCSAGVNCSQLVDNLENTFTTIYQLK